MELRTYERWNDIDTGEPYMLGDLVPGLAPIGVRWSAKVTPYGINTGRCPRGEFAPLATLAPRTEAERWILALPDRVSAVNVPTPFRDGSWVRARRVYGRRDCWIRLTAYDKYGRARAVAVS